MSEAPLQLTCRSCGIGHLVLSASGILCLDCNAKIIPTGEINDQFEGVSPSMIATLFTRRNLRRQETLRALALSTPKSARGCFHSRPAPAVGCFRLELHKRKRTFGRL